MTRLVPEIRFRLRIVLGDDIAIGPGKIDLLEAIGANGSITAAARALGMSYRRAWLLVDTMNRCFETPVVTTEAGGVSGGGTRLTPAGTEVVRRYRHMESRVKKACARDLAAVTPMLKKSLSPTRDE